MKVLVVIVFFCCLSTSLGQRQKYEIFPGVTLIKTTQNLTDGEQQRSSSPSTDLALRMLREYSLDLKLPKVYNAGRELVEKGRFAFGKNSFLTGFGLGFLAFGLKKLLLPIIIGAQIIKSVLIAMFLPTILASIGKLVGKGVTTVASQSGSSGPQHDNLGDFDFKDAGAAHTGYDSESAGSDGNSIWTYPQQSNAHATLAALNPGLQAKNPSTKTTFSERHTPKLPSLNTKHTGSFYSKDPQQDFKIFHKIPSSSHLLTNYDPFYSPLLSRLDSVFQQLGTTSEGCRERLVCDMYSNPAKFAPYSNLVSAQLSRELNELRKPSSDNPEILRFFRYMKAAKDGQDGLKCDAVHSSCIAPTSLTDSSPMLTTFNDINKLVEARKLPENVPVAPTGPSGPTGPTGVERGPIGPTGPSAPASPLVLTHRSGSATSSPLSIADTISITTSEPEYYPA